MKAAVLLRYDESLSSDNFVQYEDVPDPKIESPTDVIVRIGGAGVCRTDLHVVEGIWRSKVEIKLPYIMGHENAGWVEAMGSAVTGVKVTAGARGRCLRFGGQPERRSARVSASWWATARRYAARSIARAT